MTWLIPAVIATLSGTIVLVLVYSYLYYAYRKDYLAFWAISWFIYSFRFIFLLIMELSGNAPWLLIGNQACSLVSGVLLLWGIYAFQSRVMPRWWLVAGLIGIAWIVIATMKFSFLALTIPTFFFLAAINIWAGVILLHNPHEYGVSKWVTGLAFIIWGLHKANYPFLRPVTWFAPWGYLLAALLSFIIALGVLLLYFQRTRLELEQSEERFRAITENSTDVTLILDPDGRFTYLSPAVKHLFGYHPDEMLHHHYQDYIHPDDLRPLQLTLTSAWQVPGQTITHSEFRLKTNTGRWIFLEGLITSMPQTPGIHGTVINCRDITAARQLEKAKANFINAVSHELRTPLTPILGYAEMMLNEQLNRAEQREFLHEIIQSVNRERKLVEELLTIARIETGTEKFTRQTTNVWQFFVDQEPHFQQFVADLIHDRYQTNQYTYQYTIDPDLEEYTFHVDQQRIQQAVENLLSNAIKYSPRERLEIAFSIRRNQQELYIEIEDHGMGIPADEKEKIFQPFYQIRKNKDAVSDGIGQGLTIARSYILAHNGYIQLTSYPGEGSTFTIILPLQKQVETSPEESDNPHILLIENDPPTIALMQTILQKFPYDLTIAVNGSDATHHIKARTFQLIIMDFQLPDTTADQLLQDMPALNLETPVILCSAQPPEKLAALKAQYGCIRQTISKPFSVKKMVQEIERAMIS